MDYSKVKLKENPASWSIKTEILKTIDYRITIVFIADPPHTIAGVAYF